MDYSKGVIILRAKDLFTSHNTYKYARNRVRFGSGETVPHIIGKAVLGLLILKKKDSFLTEWEYPNAQKADLTQLKWKDKEIINYQIKHTHQDPEIDWKGVSNVFIDLNDAPDEVKESFKIIEKYFRSILI